ncbi:putative glucan endo-1,3-beta-glucosidase btgC [Penicillium oxalicum]|uniref:putative glucan endo-1,3-beta-glucosidase btgC n=1 Tax=Penicillium oxalicum TaxID=69781 RepID=UPI0020B6797B|nr:putative glucan endo-1,3-beta-glucosidase btgC [Penicillium oxalicum]KAI2793631.1 putative glucan endo-1,3-beta-glucosidase btgC [Penicillium oxalicum]
MNYDGDDDYNRNHISAVPLHRYPQTLRQNSSVTPGVDNLGPSSVGGGISGIALGVANSHDRLSGIDAVHSMDHDGFTGPAERGYHTTGSDNPYIPYNPNVNSAESLRAGPSYGSSVAFGGAAATPGYETPSHSSTHLSDVSSHQRSMMEQFPSGYGGGGLVGLGPYQRHSQYSSGHIPGEINPDDIADDGDDEFEPRSRNAAAAAAGGAAAGGMLGGIFHRNGHTDPDYGPVPGNGLEAGMRNGAGQEKATARTGMSNRKKRGLIAGGVLALIVLAAIVGGALGGTLGAQHGHSASESPVSSAGSATSDTAQNGDLNKDSKEIQALMNNPDLHKVFPGMDYTPWGVQYPLCLKYPPSQNNVTRDLAVLSQITNTVRLYGTDCNQTEMTLHAIKQLELTDMKLWLGVWIDTNETSTTRQLNQLYKILDDTEDKSIFKGVIVGNEALYRAGPDIKSAEKVLISYIKDVTSELKKRNLSDMPVATSDLGDNWNAQLVDVVDVVMSNVHPFFAGVSVEVAAAWTWDFWQTHDVVLTKDTSKKQIISEVGWPSAGGKDCGSSPVCDSDTPGSVASIDNMNSFMADWVCQALENGTDYFWFEAFDEPWKVAYNEPGKEWEDKWGLMDSARKIKSGLKIPDCGGKTAS